MSQNQVPEYRKEMRRESLKKVAQLFTRFYQSAKNPMDQTDLKKKTLQKVQEMDRFAWQESKSDEAQYKNIMFNQIKQFEKSILENPVVMAQNMVDALPDLKNFQSNVENISQEDANYLQQLITFIQSIPNSGNHNLQQDQIDAVKIYYQRLFLPIQQRIKHTVPPQVNPAQSLIHNPLSQNPSQQMLPQAGMQQAQYPYAHQLSGYPSQQQMTSSPLSSTPSGISSMQQLSSQSSQQQMIPQMQAAQQQQQAMNPKLQAQSSRSVTKPRSPSSRANQNTVQAMPSQPHYNKPISETPRQQQQQQQQMQQQMQQVSQQQMVRRQQKPPDTPPSNQDTLKNLFRQVYQDCAVFFSTPHPHHF